MEKTYSKGLHPNSLDNLMHEGRPKAKDVYGEIKKRRTLSVTDTGWQNASSKIKQMGYGSVSEFLEEWGRDSE